MPPSPLLTFKGIARAMALALCLSAIPAQAGLEEGVAAYQAGNLDLALKEFRAASEKGDSNAQYNLAMMYERGIGLAKDEKQALLWYQKSSVLGNSNAQFNLAVLFENGRGTAVDFGQAHRWYRKAAVQGDGLAMGNLGMLYIRGQGVKEDKTVGLALLMLSAAMDNSPENTASQNITLTKGLTPEITTAAQALAAKIARAKNSLAPLDEYLGKVAPAAGAGAEAKEK